MGPRDVEGVGRDVEGAVCVRVVGMCVHMNQYDVYIN